ncbi:thiolase C-terminal domain-containing protein [Streptomyces sp. Inha503]|uniref:thiolase C-terminal domain-containing protein n=1 Tax=Streptomyces sp. Inha503 TaxID=3383314 RepID=UPI0039A20FE6
MPQSRRFPSGRVSIVGAYESPRRKAPGIHPFQIHAEVIAGALSDAGLSVADVDGFATTATFPPEAGWQLSIAEVAEYVGLQPRWFDSTDLGGAAFVAHAGHAVAAIEAGLCEVAVVSYGACGRSGPLPYPDYNTNATGPGQWEVPFGPSTVSTYALAAQRHMHEYGTTSEQLAAIAVQCRENASKNEHARYRGPLTVEDVVSSSMISSPLHKFDCCVVTDSGGAFVLAATERARDLPKRPVRVLGFGEAVGQVQMNQMPDFTSTATKRSGADAYAAAGMGPQDIQAAQLYDSFTITVAMALEDLGFVPKGEVGGYVQDGNIAPTGRLPINTDGGGLSSNHPGRRGALATIEGVRLLRGESPGAQIDSLENCLVSATGGSLSATATMILGV